MWTFAGRQTYRKRIYLPNRKHAVTLFIIREYNIPSKLAFRSRNPDHHYLYTMVGKLETIRCNRMRAYRYTYCVHLLIENKTGIYVVQIFYLYTTHFAYINEKWDSSVETSNTDRATNFNEVINNHNNNIILYGAFGYSRPFTKSV